MVSAPNRTLKMKAKNQSAGNHTNADPRQQPSEPRKPETSQNESLDEREKKVAPKTGQPKAVVDLSILERLGQAQQKTQRSARWNSSYNEPPKSKAQREAQGGDRLEKQPVPQVEGDKVSIPEVEKNPPSINLLPDAVPNDDKEKADPKGQKPGIKVGNHNKQASLKNKKVEIKKATIASPAKAELEKARERSRRYLQVNSRIKTLLPGTLELCCLLYQVEEEDLYLSAEPSFATFQEWAAVEHHLAKSSAYQYLNAGRVCKLLNESTFVDSKPHNQAQLRPLLSLDNDKQVVEVWSEAVQLASVEPSSGKVITERTVAKAKRMVLGPAVRAGGPKVPHKQLEKALAAVWKVWPVEEKDQ